MGAAWLAEFRRHPEDLRELVFPHAELYGTLHAGERILTVQAGAVRVARVEGREGRMWREVGRAAVRDGYARRVLDGVRDLRGMADGGRDLRG